MADRTNDGDDVRARVMVHDGASSAFHKIAYPLGHAIIIGKKLKSHIG